MGEHDGLQLGYRARWLWAVLWGLLLALWLSWLIQPFISRYLIWWMPIDAVDLLLDAGLSRRRGLNQVLLLYEAGRWDDAFRSWPYLTITLGYVGAFVAAHWLFLRAGSGEAAHWPARRPPSRSSIGAAGFMASLLTLSAVASTLSATDHWDAIELWVRNRSGPNLLVQATPLIVTAILALFWMILFALPLGHRERYWRHERTTMRFINVATTWCLISIYVALAGGWDDGWYTGFVLSMTVLLWAFGCRVLLLFKLRRYEREANADLCFACGYDLRGTIAAGRDVCPECGAKIARPKAA